jgi:hypothetical protein
MLKRRPLTALMLAVVLLSTALLSGFTRMSGIGNVYYSTNMNIFDGVTYSRVLAGHDANGVERAHIVTADTVNSSIKPMVFSGEASSRYVLDTMIDTLEAQGYKVVAGINGDLFSTDSACPRGLTIHDGVIQSSGYDPQFVISFDNTGKAELTWTNANYGMSTEIYVPQADGTYMPTAWNANIGFFNVPHGGAKALHLYNRTYGTSTKTKGKNVEVVLDAASYDEALLRFGKPIRATVSWIQYEGANTPIGDNQLILSTAADSASAENLKMLAPGTAVEIYASDMDNGPISRSVECLGMYMLLYNNGTWVNTGDRVNPRTLLGIKPDGSIMLYELDGRQAGFASGLGLTDAAQHLIALGCNIVANLDGGGSSTIAVREPGRDMKAVVKNSPSDGAQRPVANGLFLVYKNLPDNGTKHLSVYQDNFVAMPGSTVQLSAYQTNSNYERSGYSYASGVSYEILEGDATVNQYGLFTAGEKTGMTKVRARSGEMETTVEIEVADSISFSPNRGSILTDPGTTVDINVTATYGYSPIAQRNDLFQWECDEAVGTINGFGVFTAGERMGASGNIRLSYKGATVVIPVQIGSQISFSDLLDEAQQAHWAKSYIETLADKGMINGIGDNLFGPDQQLTRAQFLAMLAKTLNGLDLSAAPPAAFVDVPNTEWYFSYVNWGFAAGVVKGIDENHFAPDAFITREQMTVMLNNFAVITGIYMPYSAEPPSFTDDSLISDWSMFAVDKIVRAGIMNGMPEGNFAPQGSANRAQAAKVTYELMEIKSTYPQNPPGITGPGISGPNTQIPGVSDPNAQTPGVTGPGLSSGNGIPGQGGSGTSTPVREDDSGSESEDDYLVIH